MKIYRKVVSVNPKMNNHVINCIRTDTDIIQSIMSGNLYGELLDPIEMMDDQRCLEIPSDKVVIKIIDAQVNWEKIEVEFSFVETELGRQLQAEYDSQSYLYNMYSRMVEIEEDHKYRLITFDLYQNQVIKRSSMFDKIRLYS